MTTPKLITDSCCLVEVPEDAGGIHLYGGLLADELKYNIMTQPGKFKFIEVGIPPGDWQLLSQDSRSLSEEQAKQIIPQIEDWPKPLYRNYTASGRDFRDIIEAAFVTALPAFHSLLKANNLNPEVRYCVLIKNKEK